jgi:hypothetical protein
MGKSWTGRGSSRLETNLKVSPPASCKFRSSKATVAATNLEVGLKQGQTWPTDLGLEVLSPE